MKDVLPWVNLPSTARIQPAPQFIKEGEKAVCRAIVTNQSNHKIGFCIFLNSWTGAFLQNEITFSID